MKTIANCTPKEFAIQTARIATTLRKYVENVKAFMESNSIDSNDVFGMVTAICNGNVDDAMEICGALCCMEGEKFANLDIENGDEDGIVALTTVVTSKRFIRFFITCRELSRVVKPT